MNLRVAKNSSSEYSIGDKDKVSFLGIAVRPDVSPLPSVSDDKSALDHVEKMF